MASPQDMLSPDSSGSSKHSAIRRELLCNLSALNVGDKLDSERELCLRFQVSRGTLRKVLDNLSKAGILTTVHGSGTFLKRSVDPDLARSKPSHLIGMLIPDPTLDSRIVSRALRGAEHEAAHRGYHVVVSEDHNDPDYQIVQLGRLLDRDLDGLIIYPDCGNVQRTEMRRLLARAQSKHLPLVMIDRYLPGLELACVLSDNVKGAYRAVEHLILSGCRRVGLMTFGPEGGNSDEERRRGFELAMQDHNLSPTPVFEFACGTSSNEQTACQRLGDWLKGHGGILPIDGIFCLQDNIAFGAFLALKHAGFRVPDDVALVGYDNLDRELYRVHGLELTSVDQPSEKIGREAMRILIDGLLGIPSSKASRVLLPPKLVIRHSCGTNKPKAKPERVLPS